MCLNYRRYIYLFIYLFIYLYLFDTYVIIACVLTIVVILAHLEFVRLEEEIVGESGVVGFLEAGLVL